MTTLPRLRRPRSSAGWRTGSPVDPATLSTARDVGGWVFGTVTIAVGAAVVIRWLLRLLDRQSAAIERLTAAVGTLTEEVRASRRR